MSTSISKKLNSLLFGKPYRPKSIILRIIMVSIVSVVALRIIMFISYDIQQILYKGTQFRYYIHIIVAFNLLSEFQIVIDKILEHFLPDPRSLRLRLAIHTNLGFVLLLVLFFITKSFFSLNFPTESSRIGMYMGLLIGLIFVGSISNALIYGRLTEKWIKSQREFDKIKQEKLKMDYNSLQDQLNPHFLFNNLSVLKSLIIYDQNTALKFTENFTDVYRYVLQSKNKVVTRLAEELEFIDAFLGLHKERLGEGLLINILIDKENLNKEIAPLTLQLLVENAIKHNICSKEQPLKIEMFIKDNCLLVSNNTQLKESTYSTKTGLKNLIERYKMLSSEEITIMDDKSTFTVKVPLV